MVLKSLIKTHDHINLVKTNHVVKHQLFQMASYSFFHLVNLWLRKLRETSETRYIGWLCKYYLVDDRWVEAVKFMDLGDRSCWELLRVPLSLIHIHNREKERDVYVSMYVCIHTHTHTHIHSSMSMPKGVCNLMIIY